MAGAGTTRISNKKYHREKRRKETISAIGFLLPNLVGFLIITFFPIFATFVLSFTEWDGHSKKSQSELRVVLSLDKPADKNIKFPTDAKIVYTYPKKEIWQKEITLPYVVTKDIDITAQNSIIGISDLINLKEWDFEADNAAFKVPSNDDILSLSDKYSLALSKNDLPYIKSGKIFLNQVDIKNVNARFAEPIAGLAPGLTIDMSKPGEEVNVVSQQFSSSVSIPQGTVILVDVFIDTIESVETQKVEYLFSAVKQKGTAIKAGDTESKKIAMISEQELKLHTDSPEKIKKYLSFENIPKGMTAEVKNIVKQGNDGIKWVGFKNYKKILVTDSRFKDYLLNTLFFLIIVPIGMAVALIMAMALNQPLKGIVAFRVLYFLPVISNIVAVAIVWRWILNADYGLLNEALRFIGIENPPQWFSSEWWARVAIVIVEVWKGAGYNMMLYLAGLQGIPHFLYEAADIDGASPWQQFWNITWPLLGPTNFFVLIMGVIGGFQAFGTQYVLTNGGPKGATTTIVYYIYNNAFQWGKMGYATAISVVLFVFVMIITAIQWKVQEGKVEY